MVYRTLVLYVFRDIKDVGKSPTNLAKFPQVLEGSSMPPDRWGFFFFSFQNVKLDSNLRNIKSFVTLAVVVRPANLARLEQISKWTFSVVLCDFRGTFFKKGRLNNLRLSSCDDVQQGAGWRRADQCLSNRRRLLSDRKMAERQFKCCAPRALLSFFSSLLSSVSPFIWLSSSLRFCFCSLLAFFSLSFLPL